MKRGREGGKEGRREEGKEGGGKREEGRRGEGVRWGFGYWFLRKGNCLKKPTLVWGGRGQGCLHQLFGRCQSHPEKRLKGGVRKGEGE